VCVRESEDGGFPTPVGYYARVADMKPVVASLDPVQSRTPVFKRVNA